MSTHTPQPANNDGCTRAPAVNDPERGDVPGWVLVTLMSAGLVVALWALAGDALEGLFMDAINSVKGN